ncbi:MAG: ABC transporter permease [Planctomycetaceae bacterium]|nr:ABC transporter permease [Planctomycetaceae bacterium]
MVSYLFRRFLIGLLTLVLITFVIYGLIRNMPGSPLDSDPAMMDPSKMPSKADIQRMVEIYGLDKPWYQAYFTWFGNALSLEFGHSYSQKKPVVELIKQRVWPTLKLSVTSLVLTYLLAIPMGLFTTVRSGKPDERGLSFLLYMLYSFPSFVAALFLQLIFAVHFRDTWLELPLFGNTSPDHDTMSSMAQAWDSLTHMILPVACFTYGSLAYYCRFVKANMEEVIQQDYIRTAKAKGLGPIRILIHHAFRNTLIPFVTLLGLTLPGLLSGAIILEQIFNWPGMGELFFFSIGTRDYPTMMALTLMFSILTLLGQLLADILYAFVDPRISYT